MTPSRRLLVALAALALLALPLGIRAALGIEPADSWHNAWWGLLLALAALALQDALALRRLRDPALQRSLPGNLPLGHWNSVQLMVRNLHSRPLEIELFDHVPAGMLVEQLPQRLRLLPEQHCLLDYRLRPLQRGHFRFRHCDVRLTSRFGLWRSRRQLELVDETRVYPDLSLIHI